MSHFGSERIIYFQKEMLTYATLNATDLTEVIDLIHFDHGT